jgi:hypothetical protein
MSNARPRDAEQHVVHEDEDEIDVELRSPVEVRTRVLILAALLRRLALENPSIDDGSDLSAEAFDEREWLRGQDLTGELTPREAALLDSQPGSVAPEAVSEVSWQSEALVTLGWAVGALALPPVGALADPRRIIEVVPHPWDETQDWLRDPAIVSELDAVREREVAEIWYWRLTIEALRRSASPAVSGGYEDAIQDVAAEALDAGLVPTQRAGDFTVRGKRLKDLSRNDVDELIAVTGQRLRALNWLCGFGKSWDDVPLDI